MGKPFLPGKIRLIALILCLLIIPVLCWSQDVVVAKKKAEAPSAVEIIAGSTAEYWGAGTDPYNFAYTVPSGSSRALIVFIQWNYTATMTDVYWNTTEQMTRVNLVDEPDNAESHYGYANTEAYVLVNPTAATANITFNFSAAPAYGIGVLAFTASGVNQSTPVSDVAVYEEDNDVVVTITVANMTTGDLAVSGLNLSTNADPTIDLTTGTLLGTEGGSSWCWGAVGYNTGTGNVDIVVSSIPAATNTAAIGFRINKL